MRRIIRAIGCALDPQRLRWTPFQALVRPSSTSSSTVRAAKAILDRFIALFGDRAFPSPEAVLAVDPRRMRRVGLSRAKVRAIKDIARKAAAGVVPTRRAAARLSDDELVERLTAARGVGRWTVEMFLIFTLGREDVLPVDDFGVREGYRAAYGLRTQPKPKALLALGERWRPHRTTAAWYLWRAADRAKRPASRSRKTVGRA
jgi:DNA-3-methyladenine glycosylase II